MLFLMFRIGTYKRSIKFLLIYINRAIYSGHILHINVVCICIVQKVL